MTVEIVVLTTDEVQRMIDNAVRAGRQDAQHVATNWLLDSAGIAKLIGVKPRSIPKLVQRDGLPAQKIGRRYRATADAIKAWVQERPRANGARSLKLAK